MEIKKDDLKIHVESEMGPSGEPRPLRFYLRGRCLEIQEVIDCWLGSDYRYFKVRTEENHVYILRQSPEEAAWKLTLFSREDYWRGGIDAPFLGRAYLA